LISDYRHAAPAQKQKPQTPSPSDRHVDRPAAPDLAHRFPVFSLIGPQTAEGAPCSVVIASLFGGLFSLFAKLGNF
jgi:hypothetical protein